MIDQLFIIKPDEALIISCLQILGWTSINDKRVLIRTDLDNKHVGERFRLLLPEFYRFYLPCKFSKYLNTWSTKSCITITRQLLKTIGFTIKGIEKVMNCQKEMIYIIVNYTKPEKHIVNTTDKFIVSWN